MTRDDLERLAPVHIASPCPARWSDMQGDEKRRFCGDCRLHVHKLSELRTADVRALLDAAKRERVCVRLYERLDGTILTKDCPSAWSVGLAEATRRVGPVVGAGTAIGVLVVMAAAVLLALATLFGDNVRALFGGSTMGALAGDENVTRRARPLVQMPPIEVRAARPGPVRTSR
jgi:hypothetical protein